MPEKVAPGPVSDDRCIREAVCIHTKKIFDSCKDEDIALYKQIFFCLSGLRRCPGHDRALLPGHKVLGAAAVRQAQLHSLRQ